MRESRYPIEAFFKARFSPRTFDETALNEAELMTILEAASTAPSCYNEQPWRFVLAPKARFFEILAPGNLAWCEALETFVLLCAEPAFARNNKPNAWAEFDCGTAWGYMTVQAHAMGIHLHAMAGFDAAKATELFNLGRLKPIAVVALGKKPQAQPFTPRKPLEALILRG